MDIFGTTPPSGPLPEEYGRVTNPEKYRILIPAARDLLDYLEEEFDVRRDEGSDLDEELAGTKFRPTIVRLTPVNEGAGPLGVALFDDDEGFPGLAARFGAWHIEHFPTCGCDACNEQLADLIVDLKRKARALVEARFREGVPLGLQKYLTYEFIGPSWGGSGSRRIGRNYPRHLRRGDSRQWKPWKVR